MDLLQPVWNQLPPTEGALLVWAAFLLLVGWYFWMLGKGRGAGRIKAIINEQHRKTVQTGSII